MSHNNELSHGQSVVGAAYYNGLMTSTYADQVKRNEDANIRSAVKAIKVALLAVVAVVIIATTSGCKDNSNPIQGAVCSTQNTPSVLCPNAGK